VQTKPGRAFDFMKKGFDSSDIMPAIHNFARYDVVIGIYSE